MVQGPGSVLGNCDIYAEQNILFINTTKQYEMLSEEMLFMQM